MNKHSKFSASASARWLKCPASVGLCATIPKTPSSAYADEGTYAAVMGEFGIEEALSNKGKYNINLVAEQTENACFDIKNVTDAMVDDMKVYISGYIDYVIEIMKVEEGSKVYVEHKVDYSHVCHGMGEGYGTADCIIVTPNTIHVIDLKYGKGVMVYPDNNPQLMLYAIGASNKFGKRINYNLHIYQPRVDNISTFGISHDDLMLFADTVREATDPKNEAVFNPGIEQCRWCPAAPVCKALESQNMEVVKTMLDTKPDTAPNDVAKYILDNSELILWYVNTLTGIVTERLRAGGELEGYKLVKKRVQRKWGEGAEGVLELLVGDKAFVKKLVGIVKAEKLVGKDQVNKLTVYPEAELVLAKDSDKRDAQPVKIEDMFDEE